MLLKEIDIPSRLLKAPEEGRLVVFAGAGVSMPSPSNYPGFEALAQHIGEGSTVLRDDDRIERYLGRLENAGVAVHSRAVERLNDPASQPSQLHDDLVRLFPSSQLVRIITTNFDRHFETVLANRFAADQPRHYEAPALPLGSRFTGIVYLHGFVGGLARELVLTDADFGRAYLTEGWARRFLLDVFSTEELFVLFIGYSADDPPIQYLTRALPVEGSDRRFAFTTPDRAPQWDHLGITPIVYPARAAGPDKHGALAETLTEWVRYTHLGALGHEAQMREILARTPPLDLERESYLLEGLGDATRRRFFIQHATNEWLPWAQEQRLLPILLPLDQPLDEKQRDLSRWCALRVCQRPEFLLTWLAQSTRAELHPVFWADLLWSLNWSRTAITAEMKGALVAILLKSAPAGDHRLDWLRMLEQTVVSETPDLATTLVDAILAPRIEVGRHWSGYGARLDLASEQQFHHEFRRVGQPRVLDLAALSPGLISLLERHLRIARALLRSAASGGDARILSSRRSAIEPSEQNFEWSPVGALIDATRDVLAALLTADATFARATVERWSRDPEDQLFVRLAINAVREDTARGSDERMQWLIERGFLYRYGLKHEVFQLLAAIYPSASSQMRERLIDVIERGDPELAEDADPDSRRTNEYEIYNVLVWLNQVAPECPLIKERLALAQERNPTFGPRPYADFDSWVGPVTTGERGSSVELLRMTPSEVAHQALDWGDVDTLAQAVARDLDWSWRLVDVLEQEGLWEAAAQWHGVLRGWTKALVDESAWSRALDYLKTHVVDLRPHLRAMAQFLLESATSDPATLPASRRAAALELARGIVDLAFIHEEPPAVGGDLLTQAVNHPVGKVAEFWVHEAEGISGLPGSPKSLASDVATDAAAVLKRGGKPARYTAAILGSQLHYLHSLDSAWANATLLPVFDWSKDAAMAEAAWHGFLTWGRWTRALFPQLLPQYLQTCDRLGDLPERLRRALTGQIASLFIYGALEEKDGLLQRFLSRASVDERVSLADSVRQILSTLDEDATRAAWNSRLDRYWALRQQGIPRPLESVERVAMLDWLAHLEPVFDRAVDRVVRGDAAASEEGSIFYALVESGLATRHPEGVYRLISHILPASSRPFYACHYAEELVRVLHRAGFDSARLRFICDALARLDCDGVGLWAEIAGA